MRPTLNHARERFVHRFTCEHKPVWATGETGKRLLRNGSVAYHAPQYRTDAEWYEATLFPGEPGIPRGWPAGMPYSRNRTWPLGRIAAAPVSGASSERRANPMTRFAKRVQGDRPAHSSRVSWREMPMTPSAGRKRGERGRVCAKTAGPFLRVAPASLIHINVWKLNAVQK
jgi:hypothetical protein